ncbi:hypothetical protein B566_EDAN010435 [Ephemera danica]|nr:hypothetical protein B566_EDAN010435 [Ephemera danica]
MLAVKHYNLYLRVTKEDELRMARGTSGRGAARPLTATELLNTPEGVQWRRVLYSEARLQSTRRSSIILAAFSFVMPGWIVVLLSLNSGLLVVLHSFAFLVSTFLLPKLQAVAKEYKPPRDGDLAMRPVPFYSPHDRFRGFVELSYSVSHILGLFLFLIEIVLVAWVKFWDLSYAACLASTFIMLPFMLAFVLFLWHHNRVLSKHVYESRSHLLESAEREFATSEQTLAAAPSLSMNPAGGRKHRDLLTSSSNDNFVPDEEANH